MVKSDKNMQKIGERKEKKRSHGNRIFLATLHTNDHDQWFGCMWRRRRPFLLIVRTILHPRSRPDLQNGLIIDSHLFCAHSPTLCHICQMLYLRMFLHPQSHTLPNMHEYEAILSFEGFLSVNPLGVSLLVNRDQLKLNEVCV